MTSNVISLQTARELIGSGSIDGKRLPLIAFMDAQQAEIERLTAESRTHKARADLNFDENERLRTALAACQTYDYRQIIEESDRYRMALETIANYSGNVEPALLLKYLAEAALKSPAETILKPDAPDLEHILDLLRWAHSKLRAFGVHTGKPESAMRMDAIELELRSHSRETPVKSGVNALADEPGSKHRHMHWCNFMVHDTACNCGGVD